MRRKPDMPPLFWRKLDTLLKHRLPLMDCLELLKKESRDKKEIIFITMVLEKLRAGSSFSMAACAGDPALKGIMSAGERAGDLAGAIGRVADRLENKEKLKGQIIGATVYPCLILLLCLGLCFILTGVVLPRFEKLFVSLGVGSTLPPLTQGLMNFGNFVRSWGLWVLFVIIILAIILKNYYRGARAGELLWRLPIVGGLWKQAHRESFFSTLGILLKSGAPLDESLKILSEALGESPLGAIAGTAAGRVKEGDKLSAALRSSGAFEESQLQLLALSEVGGDMAGSCEHLAGLLREGVQSRLKTTMSLLEPALILGMAGVVVLLVVALFLPLGPLELIRK
jgi:general secretion pathway protein F